MNRLMPTRRKSLIILTAIAVMTLLANSGFGGSINKNAGTTGFPFLKLGVGAKAIAMGGAFTAVASDPATLYYNPAGTINLVEKQMMAGYHNYVLDIQSGFLAVTLPLKDKYRLGFFIDYMNFGDFNETNTAGEVTGEFSGGDFLLGANFAAPVYERLSAGINLKFMTERAAGYSAEAMSTDIGFFYRFGDDLTAVGLSINNLGFVLSGFSSGDVTEHKDDLPLSIRAGVAHSLRELPVIASLDAVWPNDNDLYVNVGLEVYKLQPLFLRLGYSTFGENYKTESNSSELGGFSFGFGVDVEEFHISYAFVPYLDLGTSHRVTITKGF